MGETEPKQQEQLPGQNSSDPSVLGEAQTLLVQGKRFMALGDYQSATDSLEQAVQLYDAYYGVAKIQCADAYLEYGNALVALANLEAGSGTDKIMKRAGIDDGVDDEEGEEEEEDDEEADDDDMGTNEEAQNEDDKPAENGTGKENGTSIEQINGQTSSTTTADEVSMETSPEKANNGVDNGRNKNQEQDSSANQPQPSASGSNSKTDAQTSEPMPGTSSGDIAGDTNEANDEDENDEATTIEIAWEVLCLAKRLFMTDESLEGRLKLAETLQKLGEISIEWDNNDNAVSILEECLNIRKAILPAEDRLIALTYYHLGLAHSFKSDTQNANENFQNAINVIEKRILTLTADLDRAKSHQDTMAVSAHEKEISELKELLPDMTMRMDDSKEDGTQTSEVLKRTREELQQEDEEAKKVCLDRSKPVADITHLVKRKVEPKE